MHVSSGNENNTEKNPQLLLETNTTGQFSAATRSGPVLVDDCMCSSIANFVYIQVALNAFVRLIWSGWWWPGHANFWADKPIK